MSCLVLLLWYRLVIVLVLQMSLLQRAKAGVEKHLNPISVEAGGFWSRQRFRKGDLLWLGLRLGLGLAWGLGLKGK